MDPHVNPRGNVVFLLCWAVVVLLVLLCLWASAWEGPGGVSRAENVFSCGCALVLLAIVVLSLVFLCAGVSLLGFAG